MKMKSLFCWFIKKAIPALGTFAFFGCCLPLTPFGYFMEGGNATAGILALLLEIIPAYFTAKFAADNYEEYFMDYRDWLASRVSFFETKTGFVIRTFVWGASTYSLITSFVVAAIFGMPPLK